MEEIRKMFRIGELSKIFSLPVKTLRYYSDLGLLNPAYIDPDTGYRYYSVDQFVLIDVIRNSRRMGMSLKEIAAYLKADMKAEDILRLIGNQIDMMEQKISEYRMITDSMQTIHDSITEANQKEKNVPYLSEEPIQYYRSYAYSSATPEEQELNFRKAAQVNGENENLVYAIFGTSTLWEEYITNGNIINPEIRSLASDLNGKDVHIQAAGKYACIVFDDNVYNKGKYYAILTDFITTGNLRPIGDFVEEWIIPRVQNGKESTLIKIKIQVEA